MFHTYKYRNYKMLPNTSRDTAPEPTHETVEAGEVVIKTVAHMTCACSRPLPTHGGLCRRCLQAKSGQVWALSSSVCGDLGPSLHSTCLEHGLEVAYLCPSFA